eukprot:544580-Prorocentrum_minimum.AAC.1
MRNKLAGTLGRGGRVIGGGCWQIVAQFSGVQAAARRGHCGRQPLRDLNLPTGAGNSLTRAGNSLTGAGNSLPTANQPGVNDHSRGDLSVKSRRPSASEPD